MKHLHHGVVGLALVAGLVPAAAQLAPDALVERPNLGLPDGTVAPAAQLQLTPEQKVAIFNAVQQSNSKVNATAQVPTTVGGQVPPSLELYILPDRALAIAPEAKGMKYTMVQNQLVLVDPTTMLVVAVIRG